MSEKEACAFFLLWSMLGNSNSEAVWQKDRECLHHNVSQLHKSLHKSHMWGGGQLHEGPPKSHLSSCCKSWKSWMWSRWALTYEQEALKLQCGIAWNVISAPRRNTFKSEVHPQKRCGCGWGRECSIVFLTLIYGRNALLCQRLAWSQDCPGQQNYVDLTFFKTLFMWNKLP